MKTLFLSCMALGSMMALLLLMRPDPAPAPTTMAPVSAPPAVKTFVLEIRDQRLVAGEPILKVVQGDVVALRVTSDRADELHLHGYDLSLKLAAGVPGTLEFSANRSGRFDYELHHAHLELGALEVMPK